jgi:hypothetical protein
MSEDQYVYLTFDGGDFTSDRPSAVNIFTLGNNYKEIFPSDMSEFRHICGRIQYLLSDKIIIGWDIKQLFTFVLAKNKIYDNKNNRLMFFNSVICDLKILENYIGIENKCPENLAEAKSRLFCVYKDNSWSKLKNIYSRIYIPLITKVIPDIESVGVIHYPTRKMLFSRYDISGQVNGRMSCTKSLKDSFNPHSLREEEKKDIRPPCFDSVFMYFDYRHMEVSVLHWLTKDEKLEEILSLDKDVYESIWEIITGIKCNEMYRKKAKMCFLPSVFGIGPEKLAVNINVSIPTAKKLIENINKNFKTAIEWITNKQKEAKIGDFFVDCLGRKKLVEQEYKVRNFVVQAPASILCLEKLVLLHKNLEECNYAKIGFHIHDGYIIYSQIKDQIESRERAIKVLKSKSDLFPGIKLKISCKVGSTFEKMSEEEDE